MMQPQDDFWPEFRLEEVATPVSIMAGQARLLSDKTGNLVKAEVRTRRVGKDQEDSDQFQHSFCLVAPALDNYRHVLLQVRHGIRPYPLTFVGSHGEARVETEAVFCEKLKEILQHEETVMAVRMLVAQTRVKQEYQEPEKVKSGA